MGTWVNVLKSHLHLVIPVSYLCHYTNLCPDLSQTHTHTHTHIHTHTHKQPHTHTHIHTHSHKQPHTHRDKHAHTHSLTHTHTHTQMIYCFTQLLSHRPRCRLEAPAALDGLIQLPGNHKIHRHSALITESSRTSAFKRAEFNRAFTCSHVILT